MPWRHFREPLRAEPLLQLPSEWRLAEWLRLLKQQWRVQERHHSLRRERPIRVGQRSGHGARLLDLQQAIAEAASVLQMRHDHLRGHHYVLRLQDIWLRLQRLREHRRTQLQPLHQLDPNSGVVLSGLATATAAIAFGLLTGLLNIGSG